MTLAWVAAVVIAAVAVLVLAAVCVLLLRRLRQLVEQQRTLEGQVEAVAEAVCAIELRLEGTSGIAAGAEAIGAQALPEADADGVGGESIDAEIAPEIQAAIAAAAVAAAGEKARVRALRQVKAPQDNSAWSKQGRVLVQTSHNARPPR
jgi:hypothetical protein